MLMFQVLHCVGERYHRHLPLIKACLYALKPSASKLTVKEHSRVLLALTRVSFREPSFLRASVEALAEHPEVFNNLYINKKYCVFSLCTCRALVRDQLCT